VGYDGHLLQSFGLKFGIYAPSYPINPNRRHLTNSAGHRRFKMSGFLCHQGVCLLKKTEEKDYVGILYGWA